MADEIKTKLQRELKFSHIARVNYTRELADMLSHEISQPLMVISAYVSGCVRRLEENVFDKKQIIDAMKTINHQVERAGNLIHRIKDCIDKIELHYEKINIHPIIESCVSLMTHEFHPFPIAIVYKFADKLPLIEIDEAQIKLVILCLLRNGIEAMSEANTKQPQLVIETAQINAHTVSVCIKDKGRGMTEEIQNKLFNTYFTTKSKNIGMSLVMCRSIIETHKGDITAQSLLEGGAAFSFMLPILQEY